MGPRCWRYPGCALQGRQGLWRCSACALPREEGEASVVDADVLELGGSPLAPALFPSYTLFRVRPCVCVLASSPNARLHTSPSTLARSRRTAHRACSRCDGRLPVVQLDLEVVPCGMYDTIPAQRPRSACVCEREAFGRCARICHLRIRSRIGAQCSHFSRTTHTRHTL